MPACARVWRRRCGGCTSAWLSRRTGSTSSPRLHDRLRATHNVSPIVDEYGDAQCLCGVHGDRWSCFVEGGRGTVEITVGPAESMFELGTIMQPVLSALQEVLEAEGAALLGYGIQPRTRPDRSTILPRSRYYALADALGDEAFSGWSVTAADQAHVAVDDGEVATVVNALHGATPFVIALTANSSVFGDRQSAFASGREHLMGRTGADRYGMTPKPLNGLEDYVDHLLDQTVMFLRDAGGRPHAFGRQSLAELLASRPDLEPAALLDDQDHYCWASARPAPSRMVVCTSWPQAWQTPETVDR